MNMDITSIAVEYGTEAASGAFGVIIGWWANRIRAKRAKEAAKAAAKAIIILLLPMVMGCATIENMVLAADEQINNPAPRVPEGWDIYWQKYDPAGNKVDLTGYYKLPELRPKGDIPKESVLESEIPEQTGDNSDILTEIGEIVNE